MSAKERLRRPKLERTQPFRRWSALFDVAESGAGPSEKPAARRAGGAGGEDVVARAVDLGYRVIDEYIRQGQKAARRLSERSYGPQAMTSDMQDLAARMTQYVSEFTALWLDFLQRAAMGAPSMNGRAPRPQTSTPERTAPDRPGPPAPPASATEADDRARVTIDLAAAGPAQVSLDLRTAAATRKLLVHALRAVDPEKPRLTDLSFHPATDDEPARLRVSVPEATPPGVYSGLIIDEETSRPVGMLSVTIGPAPEGARA